MRTKLLGSTEDLTEAHLRAALQVIAGRPVGAVVTWPHGLRLVKGYGDFVLTAEAPAWEESAPLAPVSLVIPGVTAFGDWRIEAQIRPDRCGGGNPWHADLDCRLVCPDGAGDLTVRSRLPGDRMQPLGMEGEKKLQDLMVDARLPRALRASWPVVVSSGHIVWVPGIRMAGWARVTPETAEVLCLRATTGQQGRLDGGPVPDTDLGRGTAA